MKPANSHLVAYRQSGDSQTGQSPYFNDIIHMADTNKLQNMYRAQQSPDASDPAVGMFNVGKNVRSVSPHTHDSVSEATTFVNQ